MPTGGTALGRPGRQALSRLRRAHLRSERLRLRAPVPVPEGREHAAPSVRPPGRQGREEAEWLNDVRGYHNRGDVDGASCSELCAEQGDLGGLDDLFTEQPTVARGLGDIHSAWIKKYKVDGFHVRDAAHLNPDFFAIWVPQIRAAAAAAGVKDFELFGDVPAVRAVSVAPFVRDRGLPNMIDLPLQEALRRLRLRSGRRARDRRAARGRRLLPGAGRPRAHAADLPRQRRPRPRRVAHRVALAHRRRRAAAPRAARPGPPLPAAGRAGRPVRRRGRADGRRRRTRRGRISSRRRCARGRPSSASAASRSERARRLPSPGPRRRFG